MKFLPPLLICLGASLLLASCSNPRASLIPEDYRQWKETSSVLINYPIPGHGSNLRKIFASAEAFETVRMAGGSARPHQYPDGTIIVKEIYASSEPAANALPQILTAMIKAESDPRSRGGWIWVVQTSDGQETVMSGEFCFTCHANANESHPYGDRNEAQVFRDYVFFPPTP